MSDPIHDDEMRQAWEKLRRDADRGREPQLIPAQLGHRQVSFRALMERIEREFIEEYADSPVLAQADTTSERLKLLRSTVDYVLAVESIQMSAQDKAALMTDVYSSLFGYGPLDALFLDDRVTTISLEGVDHVSVRYGHGDLESVGPIFDDAAQLRRILRRLLVDAGADLYDDQPFVETGLVVDGRPVSLSLTTPLLSFGYHADIRVHPRQLPSMNDLIQSTFLTEKSAELLRAIALSPHGFAVVGDSESGKTTLLSVLAQSLEDVPGMIAVERAGELRLPHDAQRLRVVWPSERAAGLTFGEQIANALTQQPGCMILDEVRSDEPETIAPLLQQAEGPRQIWSFRGPFDAKRLRNALSMLARRADMSKTEAMVDAMYRRLPFVIALWRVQGQLRLYSIGEWQYHGSDYPDYVLLVETQNGEPRLTGERAVQSLNLPDAFWNPQ